ncbi:MAG: LysM peptidoglycan-binding domain-containing protein [Bacteroidales bacterium]|nr:LysM peptidoglycan-binding domain-containing protein [Bacteroidales bacterium]
MTRTGIILATAFVCLASMAASPVLRAQAYEPVPVTVSTEKVTVNGKVYLSHSVQERQTLYSIAKAYGVSVDDIYNANPTLQRTGLLKGSIILIPLKEQESAETEDSVYIPEKGTYKEHLVKWYETIDDIAAMYGLTVEALMEFNHMDSAKLNRRQVIYIPLSPEEIAAAQDAPEVDEDITIVSQPAEPDTVSVTDYVIGDDLIPEDDDTIVGKSTVNIALALPFNAEGRSSSMNMDFYAGVLLALRDLQAEGIFTHLTAFDTKAGMPSAYQLSKNDFVLGPVSLQDLNAVLERLDGETTVISPLDQKAVVLRDSFPNFIQAPSYIENQYLELAQWLDETRNDGENIVILCEKGGSAICTALKDAITARGLNYEILAYSVSEGTRIRSRLESMLQKGRMNHLVVASENESFVSDAMLNLSLMNNKGYKITSYGTSKLRLLDAVDNNYYHQTSLHLTTAYYVDYDDPDVNKFILAFRALYNTEPSQFAFQGYDTAYYFISMIAQYGDKWKKYLDKNKVCMLHLDFLFNRHENGSLSNGAIRRIIYNPDMSMVMVK